MRILQVINALRAGGAEKLIIDTCQKYTEQGILVDVLLLDGAETPFYKVLKEINGVNIIALGKENNIYNPLYIFKIKAHLQNYNIIHVHLFPALYWVAFATMFSVKKHNIVVTEHNTTNRRRKLPVFKLLDKVVYKQFKQIITISDAVDASLRAHLGASFHNFTKIYNGINLETIQQAKPYAKEALQFKETDKLIIQVASFTPQKDQKTLIKAIPLLPNHYKLILVGQGPLEETCKNLVAELEINDRVYFYGVRNDVPRLLKSVDIVVLSSFYEGLSLSSIEGMASGKPFIASAVPGLIEVVKDAGILFNAQDHKQLSNIILELINNKTHYNVISNTCIAKANSFDINIMIKRYTDLFEKNISDKIQQKI